MTTPYDDHEEWEWAEEGDDSSETVECSHCGADVYEDAPRCPVCGEYLTAASGAFAGRPTWWIWVAGALVLLFVLAYVVG